MGDDKSAGELVCDSAQLRLLFRNRPNHSRLLAIKYLGFAVNFNSTQRY